MKTIVVDDEPIMLRSFSRMSKGIENIEIVGMFEYPEEALAFAEKERVDLAILDISMPGMSGIETASKLREMRPDILIVYITAHDGYIREANQIDVDMYILKPYSREIIERMAERMVLLSRRQKKDIYVQTFGRFILKKNDRPVPLTGKAKEILALIVTKRGKEISNEEIYSTIWEGREYSNILMKVYFNALKRLKDCLAENGISDLLISNAHGQMVNTELFDCDYYNWQDNNMTDNERFQGEFLTEYSWGEYLLADMLNAPKA